MTIDFAETPLQSGLSFVNPNAASCGCSTADAGQPPAQAVVSVSSIKRLYGRAGTTWTPTSTPPCWAWRLPAGSMRRCAKPAPTVASRPQMAALMRAQALAPDHPAVLIALYRHHFYSHRLPPARDVARRALVVGARALELPSLWRDVPRGPLPGARHDPRTRFFLFALKGYAYLSLRLGDAQRGARRA